MTVAALAARGARGLLDLVLPPRCLRCGRFGRRPGAPVRRLLAFAHLPRPAAVPAVRLSVAARLARAPLCGECAREEPAYDRARAALRYDDGARRLILAFKHADRTDIAPAFGAWLARAGTELLAEAELIAPVPLHRLRLLRRGYNQAAILAAQLAQETGLPLVPDLLQRRARPVAAGPERPRPARERHRRGVSGFIPGIGRGSRAGGWS